MRVISGIARSLPLKTIPGLSTRPTTDRIKETLFNMLQSQIPGALFLDLFAGSGGIGIEALSRGAAHCYFIENNTEAGKCIQENLAFTHLAKNATLLETDVFRGLEKLETLVDAPFDYIFMDPPYDKLLEKQVLEVLRHMSYVSEDSVIIIEASLDTDFSYLEDLGFTLLRQKKYKTNQHIFVKKT